MFSKNCSSCHATTGWLPATLEGEPYDHLEKIAFSLEHHRVDYAEQPILCRGCHPGSAAAIDLNTCTGCHGQHDAAFMQTHIEHFGPDCLECHDGRDRMDNFDHSAFFVLDGRHSEIACRDCHLEGVLSELPAECVQCHAEPAIHAGFFGVECQDCHRVNVWSPALLRYHTFPLDHGEQGDSACLVCHLGSYVEYTCYGCHEHEPAATTEKHLEHDIDAVDIPNCFECHPGGQKADE
jgi:hypothetical protein